MSIPKIDREIESFFLQVGRPVENHFCECELDREIIYVFNSLVNVVVIDLSAVRFSPLSHAPVLVIAESFFLKSFDSFACSAFFTPLFFSVSSAVASSSKSHSRTSESSFAIQVVEAEVDRRDS